MVSFRQKKYKLEDISISQKHEMFNGLNFKRWKQKKMLFYLTTLNLVKFLTEKVPKTSENKFDPTTVMVVDT